MANKYNAKKVVTADGVFDSHNEYRRYQQLRLLERAGKIEDLQRQVPFELIPAQYETYPRYGKRGQRLKDGRRCIEKKCVYVADFVYTDTEKQKVVVEDTKSEPTKTEAYVIKRKLLLHIHGLRIREVSAC